MSQIYSTVGAYVYATRVRVQDLIFPFRYGDGPVIATLNSALSDAQRMRPDMFLDLKYQRPFQKGDLGDGHPDKFYSLSDIVYQPVPNQYLTDPTQGTYVPIPSKYNGAIVWYMAGHLQLLDVNDATDQRGQAFLQKYQQELLSVSA